MEDALLFGEARWYGRLGWVEHGRAASQIYLDQIEDGLFSGLAARQLYSGTTVKPLEDTGLPRLGLLLPLSGPHSSIGKALLAGAEMANQELGNLLELVPVDTGFDHGELPIAKSEARELMRTLQATRHLIEEERVSALVGPVFSTSCVVAAAVAEAAGVPLIAPLAQQSGLDQVGDHIFQLSVISEVQARVLAEYATLVLGLQTFAMLVTTLTN